MKNLNERSQKHCADGKEIGSSKSRELDFVLIRETGKF
jgi:hypothetical protein